MCLSCLFWTFVTYLSWKSDVAPMLNIINRSLPAATPPPIAIALPLLWNTQRNLHTPCLERIPRPGSQATPCIARSTQAGSTTRPHAPYFIHAPRFHPSYLHPPFLRVPIMSLQRQQAKEKKRQKRREEYSRYHAEQCWPKYRLLSGALPLLAWSLLKTHPLLPGNNSPTAGGMELGVCCCLKEYSSGPAMAPWSPADRTC